MEHLKKKSRLITIVCVALLSLGRSQQFSVTLIDSSLNGYGAYLSITNPLAFSPEEGYVAVYRQYQGEYNEGTSSGWIGSSQSEDGEEWYTEQRLNECYPSRDCHPSLPTADGQPQGRYPSAGIVEGGQPTAIWNEYTNADLGGGSYGGYPLYTYDSQGIGEFAYWINPFHLNNGCATMPCDSPPDLWTGNVLLNKLNKGDHYE